MYGLPHLVGGAGAGAGAGAGVGDLLGVGLAVGLLLGGGVEVRDGLGETGLGAAVKAQICLFPDLMHANLYPAKVCVLPVGEQVAPITGVNEDDGCLTQEDLEPIFLQRNTTPPADADFPAGEQLEPTFGVAAAAGSDTRPELNVATARNRPTLNLAMIFKISPNVTQ